MNCPAIIDRLHEWEGVFPRDFWAMKPTPWLDFYHKARNKTSNLDEMG